VISDAELRNCKNPSHIHLLSYTTIKYFKILYPLKYKDRKFNKL